MIAALLFDNDGILVDTEPLYFEATREVLAARGFQLTPAMFAEHFLRQGRGVWHILESEGITPEETDHLRDERNRLYLERLRKETVLIPGARAVIRELAGRFRLVIVTSSLREHFLAAHAATGLLPFFEFTLAREDYDRSKPAPEAYISAASRLGLPAEECLVIEDTERGLRAAKAAGMSCIMIPRGLSRTGDFRNAVALLDDIRRLPGALEALEAGR